MTNFKCMNLTVCARSLNAKKKSLELQEEPASNREWRTLRLTTLQIHASLFAKPAGNKLYLFFFPLSDTTLRC